MDSVIIRARRGEDRVENAMVAVINMASDNMLIEGGAPRFLADKINHQVVIIGNKFIMPFKSIRFREWEVSYIVLARAKSPEDVSP